MKKTKNVLKLSRGDRIFNICNLVFMAAVLFICVYPLYYCLILSFNDGNDIFNGGIYFFPRKFTLENYKVVFSGGDIPIAFLVTVLRTVIGTVLGTLFCAVFAYPLIRKQLRFRKTYIALGVFTMYFSGGLIPLYLLIKDLGMLDSFWVYIIPNLCSFFNIIVVMSFFRELPGPMLESAKIDGANEWQIFTKIVLPTSTAVLATIGLFTAVFHWNTWFDGYIYIRNASLKTLPLILVEMINQGLALEKLRQSGNSLVMSAMAGPTEYSVRLATMIVSIVPILAAYPFCQKYFVKGMMLGAVKG